MNIALVSSDDWQGLYVDGILQLENHSLRVDEVLEALGLKIRETWLEEDDFKKFEFDSLPQTLDEIDKVLDNK